MTNEETNAKQTRSTEGRCEQEQKGDENATPNVSTIAASADGKKVAQGAKRARKSNKQSAEAPAVGSMLDILGSGRKHSASSAAQQLGSNKKAKLTLDPKLTNIDQYCPILTKY